MSEDGALADLQKGRTVDRSHLLTAVGIAGLAVPVAAYFWVIHHYAVNVVFLDQWSDVNLAGRSYGQTLSVGNLWTQHAEQRMLFPNLVMLLLVHVAHMNIVVEEYLSALMLCAATWLLIWAHKRRTPSRSWVAYCPVAILLLSFVQTGSTLFGFQLAWYAAILMLAVSLILLDRPSLSVPILGAAMVAAVIGSYCTIEGLLVWPIGLILLFQRRRPKNRLIAWSVVGIGAISVYLYRFQSNQTVPSNRTGLHYPVEAVRTFFQVIGGVLGVRLDDPGSGASIAVLLFGILLFLVSAYVLITRGLRREAVRP